MIQVLPPVDLAVLSMQMRESLGGAILPAVPLRRNKHHELSDTNIPPDNERLATCESWAPRLLGCNWRNSAPSGFCLLALCRKIETFACERSCGSNYSVVDFFVVIYAIRRTAPKMTSDRILGWYLTELIMIHLIYSQVEASVVTQLHACISKRLLMV